MIIAFGIKMSVIKAVLGIILAAWHTILNTLGYNVHRMHPEARQEFRAPPVARDSHFALASHSPRARLALASRSPRLKNAKNNACSAGYPESCFNSTLLLLAIKCV